jgi:hypothetical protein
MLLSTKTSFFYFLEIALTVHALEIIISTESIVDKDVEEMLSIVVKVILRKPLSLEHLDEAMSRFRHSE